MIHGERDDTLVKVEDQIAWITLNRPESHNAMTLVQRLYLTDLFGQLSADRDVRAVVLGGTGSNFSSGADLRPDPPSGAARTAGPEQVVGDLRRRVRTGAQRLIEAILDCEKPVIASVRGTVAGMAVQVMLACDIVLAAEDARLWEVFAKRGLVPDAGATYLLPRIVGLQKAKELLFLGEAVPAAKAEQLGLVNAVVPNEQLDAVTAEWAARLAAGPTRAIALAKGLLNRSLDTDRTGALSDEAAAVEMNSGAQDSQEGINAFLERRPPDYRGW